MVLFCERTIFLYNTLQFNSRCRKDTKKSVAMVCIGDDRGSHVTAGKDIKCRQAWGKTALNVQYVYQFRAGETVPFIDWYS